MLLKKRESDKSLHIYVLLFLACLNIYELGSLLFLLVFICLVFKLNFRIPVDKHSFFICAILSIVSFIAAFFYFGINEAIKCINFIGAYVSGYGIMRLAVNKNECIKKSSLAIFLGFALQIILIYFYNLYRGQPSTRTMYAVWNNGLISVTMIGLLSSVIIGYSFYALVLNKNKMIKLFCAFSLVIMSLINMSTATRTPFLLLIITIGFLVLHYVHNEHGVNRGAFIIIVAGLALFVYFSYTLNWFGFTTFLEKSAVYERFMEEQLNTGRIHIAGSFFSYMMQYPFGGGFAGKAIHNYAHNILQEIYDLYGALAFIFAIVIYVQGIINLVKMLKKGGDKDCNYILAGLYLAILVQMILEPVIEGFPILLYVFLFIHGISNYYIHNIDR